MMKIQLRSCIRALLVTFVRNFLRARRVSKIKATQSLYLSQVSTDFTDIEFR
jgi:hypothetical protein